MVSNTEPRYNPDTDTWELYSTAAGNEGGYVVSVRQTDEGGMEYFNYTEDRLAPAEHPELFSRATWAEIADRMAQTGAVKSLFFDIDEVDHIKIHRFDNGASPAGFFVYFKEYPVGIYSPYLVATRITPNWNYRLMVIALDYNNNHIIDSSLTLYIFDAGFDPLTQSMVNHTRKIAEDENLVGAGMDVSLGTPFLSFQDGYICLLGDKSLMMITIDLL